MQTAKRVGGSSRLADWHVFRCDMLDNRHMLAYRLCGMQRQSGSNTNYHMTLASRLQPAVSLVQDLIGMSHNRLCSYVNRSGAAPLHRC